MLQYRGNQDVLLETESCSSLDNSMWIEFLIAASKVQLCCAAQVCQTLALFMVWGPGTQGNGVSPAGLSPAPASTLSYFLTTALEKENGFILSQKMQPKPFQVY